MHLDLGLPFFVYMVVIGNNDLCFDIVDRNISVKDIIKEGY